MAQVSRRELMRLAVALAALPLASCAVRRPGWERRTFFNFDTVCMVGGAMEPAVLDEAQALCESCERLFSRTLAESDVARINAAGGKAVSVDERTCGLVAHALEYCAASGGLFDITIGAVSQLWDFANGVVPTEGDVARALPHVGWEQVEVRGSTVRLADPDARIDLGGIAKGYITDLLCDLFAERGVRDAFVNLGGNVAVLGRNERGEAWSVGVRDPFDEAGSAIVASMRTTAGSLVTSGVYERSFERDGVRYWHILDPRTGYPVRTDVVSASVFSQRSIDGDGLTKPLFMLGREEALAFVQRRDGVQALLVDENGAIRTTPGAAFELQGERGR